MTETYPNKQPESFNPKEWTFINEYLKTGHATQSAITAGYSPNSAHVQANRMLKNDKIVAEISRRQRVLAQIADYDRQKALHEYDAIYIKALEDKKFKIALDAVNAKVELFGLVTEPKDGEEQQTQPIQNNILDILNDDELYDLLKQMRETGHGIDVESIGHEIAGMAPKSQTSITPSLLTSADLG